MPSNILKLAKEAQINVMSITDHDTIGAYLDPITIPLAKELNIMLITGVEISADYKKENIHVLGYNFDLNSTSFQNFLKKAKQNKDERNEKIIKKLQEKNINITMQDVYALFPPLQDKVVNRSHIALAMVKKGCVKTYKEAFQNYVKEHGCCYVSGEKCTVPEAIEAIHQAKGKAVLAHPHLLQKKNLLLKLLEMDFDGIEKYYSYNPPITLPPLKKPLIFTGGSDFHGEVRPLAPLGCSLTPKEELDRLLS
jgi:predicted metal-dependent phosphoesterase TrpH